MESVRFSKIPAFRGYYLYYYSIGNTCGLFSGREDDHLLENDTRGHFSGVVLRK